MDLHDLVKRKMDWDVLSDDLWQMWINNFEIIAEIKNKRSVVPEDAASHIACAAIYIRYKKKDDTNTCQLIFARSRLVPDDFTQPKCCDQHPHRQHHQTRIQGSTQIFN